MTAAMESPRDDSWYLSVEQAIRALDPQAFPVSPRVLRRVLRGDLDLPSLWNRLPHAHSLVIRRERLNWLVATDELGAHPHERLPEQLLLLARPEEDQLQTFDRQQLLAFYWRALFHARLDAQLQERLLSRPDCDAIVQQRIEALGQTEFDEVHAVLKQELLLMHPGDRSWVYAEFAATWFELQYFAPELLPAYFPSLTNPPAVDSLLRQECDPDSLFECTRPPELPAVLRLSDGSLTAEIPLPLQPLPQRVVRTAPARGLRWQRAARKAAASGNLARSLISLQLASEMFGDGERYQVDNERALAIRQFASRLQTALELDDYSGQAWESLIERLLAGSTNGFWNTNARLLYDLQKVCIDAESEISRVDLWAWLFSAGRVPLKTPLPQLRIVQMAKHLRTAVLRIPSLQLSAIERPLLKDLLSAAAHAAERILRRQLRGPIAAGLSDRGLQPQSITERVSLEKVIDELLDRIVHRGFATMGDLRDALSRSQLKLADLEGLQEFFAGDALLRTDRRLGELAPGVYLPGPFYLRGFQRMSAALFANLPGRWLTRYLLLPYGGAFVALMGLWYLGQEISHFLPHASHAEEHAGELTSTPAGESTTGQSAEQTSAETADVAEPQPAGQLPATRDPAPAGPHADQQVGSSMRQVIARDAAAVESAVAEGTANATGPDLGPSIVILGTILLGLIHWPGMRRFVFEALQVLWKLLRLVFVQFPRWLFDWPPWKWLMRSLPVRLFRRYCWTPLLITGLVWLGLPMFGWVATVTRWQAAIVFAVAVLGLNSRIGRDTEELLTEALVSLWHRFRVNVLVALFTLIVDVFRWLMDVVERVLYEVDERLRFRSGESAGVLWLKAIGGAGWAIVNGMTRFCVTLLIEPQINPIKHFPVVTVAHKMLLPLAIPLTQWLKPHLEPILATTLGHQMGTYIAASCGIILISAIPGVFGFLVWEFKENWKLYSANRAEHLRPVVVGHHGESMLQLLRPGFHSGTVPKLFSRRRRAAQLSRERGRMDRTAKFDAKLHEVAESVQHFVEREFIALLRLSASFREFPLEVVHVELGVNRISVDLLPEQQAEPALRLTFAEQSGWLVAGISETGWLSTLNREQRTVFRATLLGLYKLSDVHLVREQIAAQAGFRGRPYDVAPEGLVVWNDATCRERVQFALDERPLLVPRPRSLARSFGLESLPPAAILFSERPLPWNDVDEFWTLAAAEPVSGPELLAGWQVFPA